MPVNDIGVDPGLIEGAVAIAILQHPDRAAYERERERCYEVADDEERNRRFEQLAHGWFLRLRLGAPVMEALAEQPLIGRSVGRCVVTCARSKNDEGAELYVNVNDYGAGADCPSRRHVGLRVLATTFADAPALLHLARREAFYLFDMLDPAFCYAPRLPPAQAGPTHDRLLLDRYSTLWATSVDGRMVRRGYAPAETGAQTRRRFLNTFPMLAGDGDRNFHRFFAGGRPTHPELVSFATDPRAGAKSDTQPDDGSRCSLCGCPSYYFVDPATLDFATITEIRRTTPDWAPADAVCSQCVDLYRSRHTSTTPRFIGPPCA